MKIVNEINKKEDIFIYKMNHIHKYVDLYQNLPRIFKQLGYKFIYYPDQISFTFYFLDRENEIDNWNKYILNNEIITILIRDKPIYYKLIDSFNNEILFQHTSQKYIYLYYYQKIYQKSDCAILIKKGEKLIDVLDKIENYRNPCINRLVLIYGY